MYKRKMERELLESARGYPVVALLGPRQTGKTTLAKKVFPDYRYVLLEDLENREFALSDPKGFLEFYRNDHGLIIDEAQHAPGLFSYIQGIVDDEGKSGSFILTGSQNFYLRDTISQTLAGRIAILTLLPLSIGELQENGRLPERPEDFLYQGGYPRIYDSELEPNKWYQNYIHTYLEKDVRQMQQVADLHLFQKFVALCAGRIGQLMNWSELARDCGVTTKTVHNWISLLEASYLVFLLQPHHVNFSKRLVKSPKLYFYDTGLACALLKIHAREQLNTHYLKGALFESMILSELYKKRYNQGLTPNFYFWRDRMGNEIDCLVETGDKLVPLEIKSGKTINSEFFEGLQYWSRLANQDPKEAVLVYGGTEEQQRSHGKVIGWAHLDKTPL